MTNDEMTELLCNLHNGEAVWKVAVLLVSYQPVRQYRIHFSFKSFPLHGLSVSEEKAL